MSEHGGQATIWLPARPPIDRPRAGVKGQPFAPPVPLPLCHQGEKKTLRSQLGVEIVWDKKKDGLWTIEKGRENDSKVGRLFISTLLLLWQCFNPKVKNNNKKVEELRGDPVNAEQRTMNWRREKHSRPAHLARTTAGEKQSAGQRLAAMSAAQ